MKGLRVLSVALVSLCLVTGLAGVAMADITTTTTFSTSNLPTASGTFVVANAPPNFTITNPSSSGIAGMTLIPAATVGTGGFIATVTFPSGVGGTSGWVALDNVQPGGVGGCSAGMTIEPTTITLTAPAGGASTSVARPASPTPFRAQFEKKIVTGGAQYIARLDANNDGTFETTVATSPTLTPVTARDIAWTVNSYTGSVTISSIVIEPPAAPPTPVPVPQATPSASAPTMGSWGAIVMALVLLVIAGMAIRAKKVSV